MFSGVSLRELVTRGTVRTAAADGACHGAATVGQSCGLRLGQPHLHFDAVAVGDDFNAVRCAKPFGAGEAAPEIHQIAGRGHHDGLRGAVVDHGHWHLFGQGAAGRYRAALVDHECISGTRACHHSAAGRIRRDLSACAL